MSKTNPTSLALATMICTLLSTTIYSEQTVADKIEGLYKVAKSTYFDQEYGRCLNTLRVLEDQVGPEEVKQSKYYCVLLSLRASCLAGAGQAVEAEQVISNIYSIDHTSLSGVRGMCKDDFGTRFHKARLLAELGRYKEAALYQQKYVELLRREEPKNVNVREAIAQKALYLEEAKDYAGAITVYDELLSLNPLAIEVFWFRKLKARCYHKLGDEEAMLTVIEDLITEDYSDLDESMQEKIHEQLEMSYFQRVSILMDKEGAAGEKGFMTEEFATALEQALQQYPKSWHFHMWKSVRLTWERKYEEALEENNKAFELAPQDEGEQIKYYEQKIKNLREKSKNSKREVKGIVDGHIYQKGGGE